MASKSLRKFSISISLPRNFLAHSSCSEVLVHAVSQNSSRTTCNVEMRSSLLHQLEDI